jgi:hypothetical protein
MKIWLQSLLSNATSLYRYHSGERYHLAAAAAATQKRGEFIPAAA